jgi:hypothetical protein
MVLTKTRRRHLRNVAREWFAFEFRFRPKNPIDWPEAFLATRLANEEPVRTRVMRAMLVSQSYRVFWRGTTDPAGSSIPPSSQLPNNRI